MNYNSLVRRLQVSSSVTAPGDRKTMWPGPTTTVVAVARRAIDRV